MEPSDSSEPVSQRLGRLRLEAARREHNQRGVPFHHRGLQIHSGNQTEGLVWLQHAESSSSSSGASPSGPSIAGPIPQSWRPLFKNQQRVQLDAAAMALPAACLGDSLIQHRQDVLSTLSSCFTRKLKLDLLHSCLASIALDLASDDPSCIGSLHLLPPHLRPKLACLAQLVAPLSDLAVQMLFLASDPPLAEPEPCSRDCHLTPTPSVDPEAPLEAQDPDSWEADVAGDDADGLQQLDLAFSFTTHTTLHRILRDPDRPTLRYPFLTSLTLSAAVRLTLSADLAHTLAYIPTLQRLHLAQLPLAPDATPTTFIRRLAQATPRLTHLDLSYSTWLAHETISSVDWSAAWRHLAQLGCRACPQLRQLRLQRQRANSLSAARWVPESEQARQMQLGRRVEEDVFTLDPSDVKARIAARIMQHKRWVNVVV